MTTFDSLYDAIMILRSSVSKMHCICFLVVHDLDANVFLYSHDNLVISGGFDEHASKATLTRAPAPRDFNFRELTDDWDLFLPIMEKLAHRFPAITKSTADQLVSTAENYTPDGNILVGQMPEVMVQNFLGNVSVQRIVGFVKKPSFVWQSSKFRQIFFHFYP